MKKIFINFLILILSTMMLYGFENAKSRDELVSAYIYLLSKNISWSDDNTDKFKIVIVSNNENLYSKFKNMSKNMHLKDKEIYVLHVDKIDNIDYKDTQLIFMTKDYINVVDEVYTTIGSRSILLISENYDNLENSMINLYEDKKYRINIEINLNNIQIHGLDINNKVLLSSASKVGVGKLYHSSIEAIKKQEKKFKKYTKLNNKLKNDLNSYASKIELLNKNIDQKVKEYNKTILDIKNKEYTILKKEELLKEKETYILKKEQKIKLLRKKLMKYKNILNEKIDSIKKQEKNLNKYSNILDEKLFEIKELDKKIKYQENNIRLNEITRQKQEEEIAQQKTSLYLTAVIAGLLFLFLIYFYKNKLKYQKINAKLQVAKNDAIYANKSKSIFISKMSHELRTPLNAILGFSDLLLKNSNFKADDKKALKVIYSSGSFLLTLINDILNISSIESNKIVVQENVINIKNLLNDVILLVQNSAVAKSLKLEVKYNDDISCIKIDDKLIRQILINLITNSIKYSNNGTILVNVKIKKTFLYISVSDEGIGISHDDLKYIFEPFKQVGDTTLATGSGLGLAIVKQFVDTMDGKISVKSTIDKGTVFKIKIPYQECQGDDFLQVDSKLNTMEVLGVTKDSENIKILIVEDKENNILLLKSILNILNFNIYVARNGEEAIEKYKEFLPDLIFMDKRMPKMDGNKAIEIIRNLEYSKNVKIVMLSANAFSKESSKYISADEFILKPYKADEIYQIISKYFNIEYIYKDTENLKERSVYTFPHKKFKNYLEEIDKELLDELFNAAVLLNYDDMKDVLSKIKFLNKELFDILNELVKDINFMEILNTISEIKEDSI